MCGLPTNPALGEPTKDTYTYQYHDDVKLTMLILDAVDHGKVITATISAAYGVEMISRSGFQLPA